MFSVIQFCFSQCSSHSVHAGCLIRWMWPHICDPILHVYDVLQGLSLRNTSCQPCRSQPKLRWNTYGHSEWNRSLGWTFVSSFCTFINYWGKKSFLRTFMYHFWEAASNFASQALIEWYLILHSSNKLTSWLFWEKGNEIFLSVWHKRLTLGKNVIINGRFKINQYCWMEKLNRILMSISWLGAMFSSFNIGYITSKVLKRSTVYYRASYLKKGILTITPSDPFWEQFKMLYFNPFMRGTFVLTAE